LVITGSPANTDAFTVSPNSGASFAAVSDSRNALLLAGLQTSSTLANNANGTATASYQGVYSQLVSEVGNKTREFEVRSKAQAIVVSQAQQQQQSLSGVNLDEEAANLVRYQQAYQAAGKSMQIAATLFATLLSIGG
jgi:flagellar hook-associated protein 1 FlgK